MQPADRVPKLRDLEEVSLRVGEAALALILGLFYEVGRMALVAGNGRRRVLGVGEQFLLLAGDLALETARRILLRVRMKPEDEMLVEHGRDLGLVANGSFHGLGMGLARAVANLTTRHIVLAGEGELGVGGLLELCSLRIVTELTAIRADLIPRVTFRFELPSHRRRLRRLRHLLGEGLTRQRAEGEHQRQGHK